MRRLSQLVGTEGSPRAMANLAALMDLISADTRPSSSPGDEALPAGLLLAAWRSFFLTVPVVHVPFEVAGLLLLAALIGAVVMAHKD